MSDPPDAAFEFHLLKNGKCCDCGENLFPDTKFINLIILDKVATWEYPVWGNFLTGTPAIHASAVVCDACIEKKDKMNIKHAIEFADGELKYHLVSELEDRVV